MAIASVIGLSMLPIITDSNRQSITQSNYFGLNNGVMDSPAKDFAIRFNLVCVEANLPTTQVELGKALGVSGTMIWNYRNGEKMPSLEQAVKISIKLGVCVEWLLTGRGAKYPDNNKKKERTAHLIDTSGLSSENRAAIQTLVHSFKKPPTENNTNH